MPSIDREKAPSLFLIVFGLTIVASVAVAMPHAGQQKYHHEAQSVGDAVPSDSYYEVVSYDDLPSQGKAAFRAAVNDPDGHHVVYGTENVPEKWKYPTDTGPMPTYVEYEGAYYEFRTWGDSFESLSGLLAGFIAFLGVVPVVVGGWRYLDRPVDLDGRVPSGIAVAVVVGVLGFALDLVASVDPLAFVVVGLVFGAIIVTTGIGVRDDDP